MSHPRRDWLLFGIAAGLPRLLLTIVTQGDWLYDRGGTDNWSYTFHFRRWGDPVLAEG